MQKQQADAQKWFLNNLPTITDITETNTEKLAPWGLGKNDSEHLHYHNAFEIGMCFEGSGVHCTPFEQLHFDKGDIMFILPGQPHIASCDDGIKTKWMFLYIDAEELFEKTGMSAFYINYKSNETLTLYDIIHPEEYPEIADTVKRLIDAYVRFDNHRIQRIGLIFAELLIVIAETRGTRAETSIPSIDGGSRLKNVISQIRHMVDSGTHPSTEEMAALAYMSVSGFRNLFTSETGISPHGFVIERAISNAQRLLVSTKKSVLEISNETGFNSLSSFNRNFKLMCGVSPEKYRRDS